MSIPKDKEEREKKLLKKLVWKEHIFKRHQYLLIYISLILTVLLIMRIAGIE